MINRFILINNCKHYFLNEQADLKPFYLDSPYTVERDFDLKHPFGDVYKPKGCIDTPIRFVRQINNSILLFKAPEWNVIENPFCFNVTDYDFPIITKFIIKLWQKNRK